MFATDTDVDYMEYNLAEEDEYSGEQWNDAQFQQWAVKTTGDFLCTSGYEGGCRFCRGVYRYWIDTVWNGPGSVWAHSINPTDLYPEYEPEYTRPAFNAAVEDVLNESLEICTSRGAEYEDTWHVDNIITTFVRHALRTVGITRTLTNEEVRLISCAALVDVKDARLLGPGLKRDTVVDGINYRAAYAGFYEEYTNG